MTLRPPLHDIWSHTMPTQDTSINVSILSSPSEKVFSSHILHCRVSHLNFLFFTVPSAMLFVCQLDVLVVSECSFSVKPKFLINGVSRGRHSTEVSAWPSVTHPVMIPHSSPLIEWKYSGCMCMMACNYYVQSICGNRFWAMSLPYYSLLPEICVFSPWLLSTTQCGSGYYWFRKRLTICVSVCDVFGSFSYQIRPGFYLWVFSLLGMLSRVSFNKCSPSMFSWHGKKN